MASRKKVGTHQRPPPRPSAQEGPLSEAVAHGLAALGSEATASEVERWVKSHHLDVWLTIHQPRVLLEAIEAEREKLGAARAKGENGMARRKKDSESQPERARDEAKASANDNDRESPPAEVRKASSAPGAGPAGEGGEEPARKRRPGRPPTADSVTEAPPGRRGRRKDPALPRRSQPRRHRPTGSWVRAPPWTTCGASGRWRARRAGSPTCARRCSGSPGSPDR